MKTTTIVTSFLATAAGMAVAQNSTSTNSTSSSSIIPSGLSTSCNTYLQTLDTDSSLSSCMAPLVNLTAAYTPSTDSNGTLVQTVTTQQMVETLSSLCSTSSGCSDSLVRSSLTSFYSACSTELTASNTTGTVSDGYEQVRLMYDYLYVIKPFQAAVCSKDSSSSTYCVLEIAGATSSASSAANSTTTTTGTNSTGTNYTENIALNSFIATSSSSVMDIVQAAAANLFYYTSVTTSSLSKRLLNIRADANSTTTTDADVGTTIMTPNVTTYRDTNLPYLFLQPNMSSSILCGTCTTAIMAAYVAWEAEVPYALGLSSSPILGSQATLWSGIEDTCGSNFTSSITEQAGVLVANSTTLSVSAGERGVAATTAGSMIGGLVVLGLMSVGGLF